MIDALVQGQADIGIASGQHTLNGMREIALFEDSFGLVCTPQHPLAQRRDDPTLHEVREAGFIYNNLCDLIQTPTFHVTMEGAKVAVHNTLSLIAMVQRQNWVTVLPKAVVQVLPGQLIFRPIRGISDKRRVSLYIREEARFLSVAEEFSQLAVSALSQLPS